MLGGLAALAAAPPQAGSGRPRFSGYPFRLGVASGDPTPDGCVLWTRLAPEPLAGGGMATEDTPIDWQVATDEAFESVVASGNASAPHTLAHSVHIEVTGLEPHRWYFYRFRAGGEISPVGRFRTTPAATAMADQLRFAFASCQHYETGLYTAYEHMAREDLDLVAHLGDYIYEGPATTGRVRSHVGNEIVTREDYRNRYALYRSDPYLQQAHAAFPWIVTWDDHEFDNNYADRVSEEEGVSVDDFLTRRANAYQAYYEHMPIGSATRPRGADMRLYRGNDYGRLASFHVLDTRQYRSDQACGDRTTAPCDGVFGSDRTLLGDEQERWLSDRLGHSNAVWDVLAQQIMVGRVDRAAGDEIAWSMDQWSGYDAARKRLVGRLAQSDVVNPIVLTGDIHSNWVNDIQVDFDREEDPVVATEFVGTSITSAGDGSPDTEYAEAVQRDNPFVRFFNRQRGYVSCTVTPESWKSDYQVVEYVSRPGAPLITRASFVVEEGRPGAKQTASA
jgi:alkaline phosphatase D